MSKSKHFGKGKSYCLSPKINYGVQKQEQTVNVNIAAPKEEIAKYNDEVKTQEPNPYADLDLGDYSDNEIACKVAKKYCDILCKKDKHIKGLEFIIEMIKSDPYVDQGKIITIPSDLEYIILLLTNAESVEFHHNDIEIGCCCNGKTIVDIDKIFVRKDGKTLHFENSFIEEARLLDVYRISYRKVFL